MMVALLASVAGLLAYGCLSAFEAAFHTQGRLLVALHQQGRGGELMRLQHEPGRLSLALLSFGLFFVLCCWLGLWPVYLAYAVGWLPIVLQQDIYLQIVFAASTTVLTLLLGEIVPKMLARRYPVRVLRLLYRPVFGLWLVVGPLHRRLQRLQGRARRHSTEPLYSKHELQQLVQQGPQTVARMTDAQYFANALRLNTIRVEEFMVPRSEVVSVPLHTSPAEILEQFIHTALGRILVYAGSPDKVVGYVHSQSLYARPASLQQVLRPVLLVPVGTTAHRLLAQLNAQGRTLAVVMEHGRMAGLVTLEDLMEVVFGDIADEHDEAQQTVDEALPDGTYRLAARLTLEHLRSQHGIVLPEGAYATLGGALLSAHPGHLQEGSTYLLADYLVTVEALKDGRPQLLRVARISSSQPDTLDEE